jgi:hypothetical protein
MRPGTSRRRRLVKKSSREPILGRSGKPPGTVPILRSPRSKMGLSPSPGRFSDRPLGSPKRQRCGSLSITRSVSEANRSWLTDFSPLRAPLIAHGSQLKGPGGEGAGSLHSFLREDFFASYNGAGVLRCDGYWPATLGLVFQHCLFPADSSSPSGIMAKSKRTRIARNKIADSLQGALITADPFVGSAIAVHRSNSATIARTNLLSAELEEVIEIIARERVYRAMLARLGRRLLLAPTTTGEDSKA